MTARKPSHLKLLSGTARPDRVAPATPVLPALEGVPTAPTWLTNLDAVKEWHRLAPVMVVCKLLNTGNVGLFAQLCALHGHLIQAWASDAPPTAALLSAYRAFSVALGLSSMALSPSASKPNRFLVNAKRR